MFGTRLKNEKNQYEKLNSKFTLVAYKSSLPCTNMKILVKKRGDLLVLPQAWMMMRNGESDEPWQSHYFVTTLHTHPPTPTYPIQVSTYSLPMAEGVVKFKRLKMLIFSSLLLLSWNYSGRQSPYIT